MTADGFPEPFEDRLRWAIRESALIGGILVFWVAVGLGLMVAIGIVAFLIEAFRIEQLRFVYGLLRWDGVIWAAVTPLASATTGLYVLVRAGTILIDRYQTNAEETS